MSYSKIAIRDTPKQSWKLFAIGVSRVIECWTMTMTSTGTIDLEDDYTVSLDKHTDYVLDIMVRQNEIHHVVDISILMLSWDCGYVGSSK